MQNNQTPWIALNLAGRLDGQQLQQLLDSVDGKIETVFTELPALSKQFNLTSEWVTTLQSPKQTELTNTQRWLEDPNHHCIHWQHSLYPTRLKEIPNPPIVLYIKGNPTYLNQPHIAMVGSRYPSRAGIDIAEEFSAELTDRGAVVCSGLALGIDSASHRGALSISGKTTAVLGNGLNTIYPKSHRALADEIVMHQGALISEFPLHFAPQRNLFPQRNRIISGLSLGILVVEAALKSGSLITARYAGEHSRDVFAIPSSLYNPLSAGCHQLIQQGAKLVTHVTDILEEYPQFFAVLPTPKKMTPTRDHPSRPMRTLAQKLENPLLMLLECVALTPTSMDRLVAKTKRSAEEITALLLQLELAGKVQRVAGGYIRSDR